LFTEDQLTVSIDNNVNLSEESNEYSITRQVGNNDGRALLALGGNKNHPLTTISGGEVSKPSRSRASSKSPIKFLAADPANFRAMVQQVTGVLDRILSPDQYSRASHGES
jgi:hypothetical protein